MKTFFGLLFILTASIAFSINSSDIGITTTDILQSAQKTYCIGEELAQQKKESSIPHSTFSVQHSFLDWTLVDSLRITGLIGPTKRLAFSFDPATDTIESYFSLDSLPTICQQAVTCAPTWIREELISAFWRLSDRAEFYAQLLLSAPAQYADEIAFCIAKIGPEVLKNHLFNPDLLLENVTYLYQIDDSLQYADIVDYGSPPGDYYSTVRYCVLDNGDTTWTELPRDIYYYYIVHPTTSDELPRLDDYVYNKHWREYFFFEADSGFPILSDYIKQTKVVWSRTKQVFQVGRPFTPTDGALDVIGNWVTRTNISGATGNRPIHPNVIAHEHNGNCGEIQDIWTAACRTCLIPAVNCSDPCEDHVWNEFYDGQWFPLASDPATHIADSGAAYEEAHGGSKRVSAIYNWRPDGYWWTVTGHYSNSCSLYIRVYDQMGIPIDGARLLLNSEYWYGGLSICAINFTNREGIAGFELGDLRNFYVRITTPYGNYPVDPNAVIKIINVSQTNAVYYKTFYLPYTISAPRPRPATFSGDSIIVRRLGIDLNLPKRIDFGFCISRGAGTGDPDDSVRFNQFYADKQNSGMIDFYITNTSGYNNYLNRTRFGALFLGNDILSSYIEFTCPDTGKYYAIISNEDRAYAANWLDFNLKLYVQSLSGVTQENQMVPIWEWQVASLNKGKIRVKFTPSPFSGGIKTPTSGGRLGGGASFKLQLYNATGSNITNGFNLESENDNELCYNVRTLPTGIYFLKLESGNNRQTKKIAIVR
jgi:hypothetical protein